MLLVLNCSKCYAFPWSIHTSWRPKTHESHWEFLVLLPNWNLCRIIRRFYLITSEFQREFRFLARMLASRPCLPCSLSPLCWWTSLNSSICVCFRFGCIHGQAKLMRNFHLTIPVPSPLDSRFVRRSLDPRGRWCHGFTALNLMLCCCQRK